MYRNAWWDSFKKDIVLSTWNKHGKRVRVHVPFKPYLYVENKSGTYKSIFGKPLVKREFDKPYLRTKFKKEYGGERFFDDFDVTQQFLLDVYWNKVDNEDFREHPLRTIFFDIEVDPLPSGEFPDPKEAKAEINIITAYDFLDNKYHVFSKKAYKGEELRNRNDVVWYEYDNEYDMLEAWMDFWKKDDYPDIVAGWNSNGFDFPYLFNRIIRQLGEDAYNSLSPYNSIYTSEKENKMGKMVTIYHVAGVTLLDTLDVYQKFKQQKQESYKLDFICNMELGVGKVDYYGMTIYEFMEYDWDRFVEYNVRDVELLVKLEERTHHFDILRITSNMACSNYDKGLMTIPITNGAVAVRAKRKGVALNTFVRHEEYGDKPGAFCSSHPGFHRNVVTVDANSLYPNLVISNNISPETKVGMCYFKLANAFDTNPDDEVSIHLVNGKTIDTTRSELIRIIKKNNLVMSGNGCLFRQDFEGIVPTFMREVYEMRVETKAEIDKFKERNKMLYNELEDSTTTKERKDEINEELAENLRNMQTLNVLQLSYKLLINSSYGSLSSRANPIGDDDLANAITMMGSTLIQKLNDIIQECVREYAAREYKNLLAKETDETKKREYTKKIENFETNPKSAYSALVFNDTDSGGFSLELVPVKMFDKHDGKIEITPEGYNLVNSICKDINERFVNWYVEKTNSSNCRLVFKREKICDIGIWLKKGGKSDEEAKKNYVCRVIDDENVQHFDGKYVKYTGVKLARSVIPKPLKNASKEIVFTMLESQDRKTTDIKVQELYDKYCNMEMDEKAAVQKANGIEKRTIPDSWEFLKGTPGHIKPAISYNRIIAQKGLVRLSPIVSGDTYKIVNVKTNNKWGIDKIAYLDEWPKEFDEYFQIDNQTGFKKIIFDEIARFYKTVNWPAFNPADNYAMSLLDILDL